MTIALAINSERSTYISFTGSFFEDQAAYILVNTPDSDHNEFFFLLPFDFTVWASIVLIIWILSFYVTLLSKLSPYGCYGKKMHALQTCSCASCKQRRDVKVTHYYWYYSIIIQVDGIGLENLLSLQEAERCRFKDTEQLECRVEKTEQQDCLDDMTFGNSAWIVSAGRFW